MLLFEEHQPSRITAAAIMVFLSLSSLAGFQNGGATVNGDVFQVRAQPWPRPCAAKGDWVGMGPALHCSAPRSDLSLLSSFRRAVVLLERSGSHGGVLAAPFSPLLEKKIGTTTMICPASLCRWPVLSRSAWALRAGDKSCIPHRSPLSLA